MSYKLGLLLSIPFLMMVLLLLGDLIDISLVRESLDSLATTVSYRIAYEGRLSQETKDFVARFDATVTLLDEKTPRIGDTVVFRLSKEYTPFIIDRIPIDVKVTRSCVVGYFDH